MVRQPGGRADIQGRLGHDIESRSPETRHLRFIQVTGRVSGGDITAIHNEIRYQPNRPETYILAVERLSEGGHRVHYIYTQAFRATTGIRGDGGEVRFQRTGGEWRGGEVILQVPGASRSPHNAPEGDAELQIPDGHGPEPWMLRAFRARLVSRLQRSPLGAIIEYPTDLMPKCRDCRQGRARLRCTKCIGRGKLAEKDCHYCSGYGEHYVCLYPDCPAYHDTWVEENAEIELVEGAILAAVRNVALLSQAEARELTVRFHYRLPNGTEGRWEVKPYLWEFEERSGRRVQGVQPGSLYVHASFYQPGYKTRRFAIEGISDLQILGNVPARGNIERADVVHGFSVGDFVVHPVFGLGHIRLLEGTSEKPRAVVEFRDHGTKTLDPRLAKLRRVESTERHADTAAI